MTSTDTREAARLADMIAKTFLDEYEGNIPVGNITPDDMESIERILRAWNTRATGYTDTREAALTEEQLWDILDEEVGSDRGCVVGLNDAVKRILALIDKEPT